MRTVYPHDPNSEYDAEDLALELKKFEEFFPGKRLLCLKLDGFSHEIVYDDVPKTSKAHSIEVSFYRGEAEDLAFCANDEAKALQKAARNFLRTIGFAGHSSFQNNPMEIIYVDPEDR